MRMYNKVCKLRNNSKLTHFVLHSLHYGIFLETVPYRFYNIFAIALVIIIILAQKDYGPMYAAEKRARLSGNLVNEGSTPMMSKELDAMNVKEGTPLQVFSMRLSSLPSSAL